MGKNISLKSIEDFETQDVQFYIQIQVIHKAFEIFYLLRLKMCVKVSGVDTCVGATASGDRYILFEF